MSSISYKKYIYLHTIENLRSLQLLFVATVSPVATCRWHAVPFVATVLALSVHLFIFFFTLGLTVDVIKS
jgi:hypothetical protein